MYIWNVFILLVLNMVLFFSAENNGAVIVGYILIFVLMYSVTIDISIGVRGSAFDNPIQAMAAFLILTTIGLCLYTNSFCMDISLFGYYLEVTTWYKVFSATTSLSFFLRYIEYKKEKRPIGKCYMILCRALFPVSVLVYVVYWSGVIYMFIQGPNKEPGIGVGRGFLRLLTPIEVCEVEPGGKDVRILEIICNFSIHGLCPLFDIVLYTDIKKACNGEYTRYVFLLWGLVVLPYEILYFYSISENSGIEPPYPSMLDDTSMGHKICVGVFSLVFMFSTLLFSECVKKKGSYCGTQTTITDVTDSI
jgi:hypothetical protein